jgi:hypothetical protein
MNYRILLAFVLFSACKKTDSIGFHGRVSVNCNNEPLENAEVDISRIYDNGTTYGDHIATAVTDAGGNFSVLSDVVQNESFLHYTITVRPINPSSPFIQSAYTFEIKDKDDNVELNLQCALRHAYRFHIKNVNPVDTNDVFEFIALASDLVGSNELHRNLYLYGTTIDTSVIYFHSSKDPWLAYSYTKSGSGFFNGDSQIHDTGCMDTVNVDMLY